MSAEQNKTIVRRLLEEVWDGNLAIIDEAVAPDYIGHDPSQPEPTRGPDGVREFINVYLTAYPEGRITVDQQFAEGDWVATRWTGKGKQTGELSGIPPTGKQVTVTGLTLSQLRGGKVVEEWTVWDTLGMLQQLGVVPALAEA